MRPRSVIAVVPAHNEGAEIAATLESLRNWNSPSNEILVLLNNCADRTEEVASAHPVDVLHTVDSQHQTLTIRPPWLQRAWWASSGLVFGKRPFRRGTYKARLVRKRPPSCTS